MQESRTMLEHGAVWMGVESVGAVVRSLVC